jgi:hypothetical protein
MNARFSHLAEEIEISADPCTEDLIDFSAIPFIWKFSKKVKYVLFLILDLSIVLLAFLIGAILS